MAKAPGHSPTKCCHRSFRIDVCRRCRDLQCLSAADGSRHTLPQYWDMSDPVAGQSWPDAEPFGLVYEEAEFLSLLGVQIVGEAVAEDGAQTEVERDAVLALA